MSDHYNRFYKEILCHGSGKSMLYDSAANYGSGGYVSCQDLIRIWKDVEEEGDGSATVTLEIEVKPVTFYYFPTHPRNIIIIVDVETSNIDSENTTIKRVEETLKTVTEILWSAHPGSTISIVSSNNMEDGLTEAYHRIKDLDEKGTKEKYQRAVFLITDGLRTWDQVQCMESAQKIKHQGDGNTLLFAIGMEALGQPWLASLVTAPDFYKEIRSEDIKKNRKMIKKLLDNVFELHAGSKVTIYDTINTVGYEYVEGSIAIQGVQDGIPLKNYPLGKLPNVNDSNVKNGNLSVDLGILPYGDVARHSITSIQVSYQIRPKTIKEEAGYGPIDYETHIRYQGPMHFLSDTDLLSYPRPAKRLSFPDRNK